MAFAYAQSDLCELAAIYLNRIQASQGFVEGNKRTAALATLIFLDRNGLWLELDDAEAFSLAARLSQGELNEDETAELFRQRLEASSGPR